MTQAEIISNLDVIRKAIDQQIPIGDIDGVEGKMMELCSMMGLSAECYAKAQMNLAVKQGVIVRKLKYADPNINATMLKLLLESDMAQERMVFDYAERLNAALVHVVDGLRTAISKYKAEREISTLR